MTPPKNPRDGAAPGYTAIVTTSPYQIFHFVLPHAGKFAHQPIYYTNASDDYAHLLDGTLFQDVTLARSGTITTNDIRSLVYLTRSFKQTKPTLLITLSPKAGLVGQLAGRFAGVPERLHIFTGQVWADSSRHTGIYWAARLADSVTARLANHILADSHSQADFMRQHAVAPHRTAIEVIGHGSIRGVDLDRFHPPSKARPAALNNDTPFVFLFVGRLTRAKGLDELLDAFGHVRTMWDRGQLRAEPQLWCVGPDEEGRYADAIAGLPGATWEPMTTTPDEFMRQAHVLVLPSHREGFGSTIIEAAATGIPAIGTDIPGIRDAIVPEVTGWLIPPHDPVSLSDMMQRALSSPETVREAGLKSLERAAFLYDADEVAERYNAYLTALGA